MPLYLNIIMLTNTVDVFKQICVMFADGGLAHILERDDCNLFISHMNSHSAYSVYVIDLGQYFQFLLLFFYILDHPSLLGF
jgi:hypothetical protein